MNKDSVIDSLGRIDEDMIRGVEALRRKKKRSAWLRWGAMAACLCLVFACGLFYHAQSPADLQSIVTQGAVNTVAYMTWVPIDERTAVYQQVGTDADRLKQFVGTEFLKTEFATWYRPKGSSNLKYLIREDESAALTLWMFSSFEMEAGETYTYGDVLRVIFGVENAEDIVSITTSPFTNNNTDLGKAIQKKIGTHTYTDPEAISAFYDIVKDVVCFGEGSYNPADDTRFTYSFSTDENDKLTSGESTYGTRCLSIELADGTTLDSWKYTALSGSFFEYGSIFTEPLAEDDVQILNGIFGIR